MTTTGETVDIIFNTHVYPTYVVVYDVVFLVINWSPERVEGASISCV